MNTPKSLKGEITIPGDKSISHRAVMFGSIAKGTTVVRDFLMGADCLSTIDCFRKMGVSIDIKDKDVIVHGKGLHGLKKPEVVLDAGNSGTTTRLICGILSAQEFTTRITGDNSIQKRPMNRIITPLSLMGADIKSEKNNGCAPLIINKAKLNGIHYNSPVASAQVKSSILLAGLYADGETSVTEPYLSRNHTEIMLEGFGATVTSNNTTATVKPADELYACDITVPGDISSAAYFIVAALIVPGSELLIKNVSLNPTRDGIIKVCKAMGGNITIINERKQSGEIACDLVVKHSSLKGITISGEIIPTLIDEIPIISILATFAEGTTTIADASELKVKESNRIDSCVNNLKTLGVDAIATDDGMIITGGRPIHGGKITTMSDHRIAMSFAIASLMTDEDVELDDRKCVEISYPDFYQELHSLIK